MDRIGKYEEVVTEPSRSVSKGVHSWQCAPTGIGMLILIDDMIKHLKPTIYGGGMNNSI